MPSIREAVARVAAASIENAAVGGICYGTIKKVDPLEVSLDQKLTLPEKFLSIAQHLTDYKIECDIAFKDGCPEGWKGGEATITLRNALKEGDRVAVAQLPGGQQYCIVDRLSGGEV